MMCTKYTKSYKIHTQFYWKQWWRKKKLEWLNNMTERYKNKAETKKNNCKRKYKYSTLTVMIIFLFLWPVRNNERLRGRWCHNESAKRISFCLSSNLSLRIDHCKIEITFALSKRQLCAPIIIMKNARLWIFHFCAPNKSARKMITMRIDC